MDSPAAGVKKKSQNYKGKHATMEGENNKIKEHFHGPSSVFCNH